MMILDHDDHDDNDHEHVEHYHNHYDHDHYRKVVRILSRFCTFHIHCAFLSVYYGIVTVKFVFLNSATFVKQVFDAMSPIYILHTI